MRKRYIGDFDHAVLATRASGTGNSARSLIGAVANVAALDEIERRLPALEDGGFKDVR